MRLLMAVTFHTWIQYVAALLSLLAYFAFVAGYCLAPPDSVSLLSKTDPVYQVFFQARSTKSVVSLLLSDDHAFL